MSADLNQACMSIASAFTEFDAESAANASPLRAAIAAAHRLPEPQAVQSLRAQMPAGAASQAAIAELARHLVVAVRAKRKRSFGIDMLMHEFSLSSNEGVALMCVAEALLRIPDAATARRLIADKIGKGNWTRHLGISSSLFVNAAAWGLLITGKLSKPANETDLRSALTRLVAKGGAPLIHKGMELAVRMLGRQFVAGQTIENALAASRAREKRGYRHSYDMLGEAALTKQDAENYYAAYEAAIHAIGRASQGRGIRQGPGVSIKLSALHPRYARSQRGRVMQELLPALKELALLAKRYDIGLTIDAEESERLELSLDLFEALALAPELDGFDGFGMAVQAYQKRCPLVIDFLLDLAKRSRRKFMIRLVKGAYWDSEIKRAQIEGMRDYPVYTRKEHTDMSYLVCARKLLAATECVFPQFATHNAHTLVAIHIWAQQLGSGDYEFQCLHGMGEDLYDEVVSNDGARHPCRIYAPVGSHRTLLAYLVRRLLENGANTSFVNRIMDESVAVQELIADPFEKALPLHGLPHPRIPLPSDLFGAGRKNSAGIDLNDDSVLQDLGRQLQIYGQRRWHAAPLVCGPMRGAQIHKLSNPADRREIIGEAIEADVQDVQTALEAAHSYASIWQAHAPAQRAEILLRAADLFEKHRIELFALAVREAGKTLPNAVAEVREAVDFLRYYANQIRELSPVPALGPVACISPWNFPLAIFTGQISAALAAGNTVLAKPAEQTPLIAHRAVELLHEAGVPRAALQLLPGAGETIGAMLIADARIKAAVFTGSTDVALAINRTLAQRSAAEGCELPLIAETGGQNAMIVDSSALTEQVVQDVLASAFDSAGQRCSALRVLCLQEEIADRTLHMLRGAMQELCIDKPDRLNVDIGPVIDEDARQVLLAHVESMKHSAKAFFQLSLPEKTSCGSFVAPTVLEITSLAELKREVFGPILHVLRYRHEQLPQLLDAIHATGYGLTLGLHTRLDETIDFVVSHAQVGNLYVNRTMIGAVVGAQPFGGEGKSGTGPKAGGPLYLHRLLREPDTDKARCPLALPADAIHFLPPAWRKWKTWAAFQHDSNLLNHISLYESTSLAGVAMPLSGPTGESNTLRFAARTNVLCIAATRSVLLNQLAAVYVSGGTAIVDTQTATCLPKKFPEELHPLIVPLEKTSEIPLHLALVDSSLAARMRILIAQREDMLVPVLDITSDGLIPLWRLVVERSASINTSANGGNAMLLSMQ